MIPEDRPFDVDAWNAWVDHPISIRPPLTLEFVIFQTRLAEFFATVKHGRLARTDRR